MTERYLLDRDVLQALENPDGNRQVRAWAETVNDDALFLSVITVMEARKGFARARLRVSEPRQAARIRAFATQFDALLDAFGNRLLPIDRTVAEAWGEMLAERETNVMDTAVAATAAIHSMIVATRNIRDFRRRGVAMIDPFKSPARMILP